MSDEKKLFKKQYQKYPGIQNRMIPVPDCGENTYVGRKRLENKRILVTGGDSGIGRAAVIAFAREGAAVVFNHLPEEKPDADDLKRILKDYPVRSIPGDLRDEDFCILLVEKAVEAMGGIDVLVNNAGRQIAITDVKNSTNDDLMDTFFTNVFAPYWLIKKSLKYMKRGSCIINTSSGAANSPLDYLVEYSASKAAISCMTKALAKQLAPRDIRVNAVAPGPVWSALQISGGNPRNKIENFGSSVPLGRPGEPAELAPLYVLLASDEASFCTGSIFPCDGGTTDTH